MWQRRVAVTGAGLICPLADSSQGLHRALCERRTARRPLARLANAAGPGPIAHASSPPPAEWKRWGLCCDQGAQGCEIHPFTPQLYLGERNLRPLDRISQLVVVAAQLALADRAAAGEPPPREQVGLVLGTMLSGLSTIAGFDRRVLQLGPSHASPMEFANSVLNAAAGQAAVWHGLRGINSTVAAGEASGLLAIAAAADLIGAGRAPALLAGGADELSFESFHGLYRAGRLCGSDAAARGETACAGTVSGAGSARPSAPDGGPAGGPAGACPAEVPVPFDARRNGFTHGEAACLLVLEEEEAAAARGARVRAEILGAGSVFDASGGTRRAAALARAIGLALAAAGCAPEDIGCVSAGASGSVRGDRDEAMGLAAAFGARAATLPVAAIKGALGESLGAGGALQAIDLVAVLADGVLPGIAGLEHRDPACPLGGAVGETREVEWPAGPRRVLATAVGADGHCCALVLGAG